jgi:4-amino-4-deoxy-L-arabinose transferase-like glycosyltransferase
LTAVESLLQEVSAAMKSLLHSVFGNWRRTLLSIFVVALLIRGVFVLSLQGGFYFPDSVHYSRAAINLLTNGELGESYHRPPGYPVFLASIYLFFGESILAVRMVESVMGALLAVMIALIGKRIGGQAAGAIAGILWSIYPLGVFITGVAYPTNLLTVLLACGLLCFLPDEQQEFSPKRLFAAGVIWGLAALTIPVVLATIGMIGLWLIYWGRVNRLRLLSPLFLGAALVVLPWTLRDFYVYRRVVIVEPRAVQHLPRMRSADPELRDRRVEAILNYPVEFAGRFGRKFVHFWKPTPDRMAMDSPEYREQWHAKDQRVVKDTIFGANDLINAVSVLSTGPLFLFAIIGTFAMCVEQKRRRDVSLLWALILSFAVIYSMFVTRTRYRIPIEPYITILSAYGLKMAWSMVAVRFGFGAPRHSDRLESPKQFGSL